MRIKMTDGIVVDTDKALARFDEETDFNGNNHISRATGSQWDHETLYRSAKGRYYILATSQRQGSLPSAFFVSDKEAAAWLVLMEREIPDDLKTAADTAVE